MLLLLYYLGDSGAFGGAILNMAMFGTMIVYAMQMWAFLVLRVKFPQLERPYRSPFGSTGALTALVIALIVLVMLFTTLRRTRAKQVPFAQGEVVSQGTASCHRRPHANPTISSPNHET